MNPQGQRPFTIHIFLPDGIPEGLKIVTKSHWTGVGVVCPRSLFAESKGIDEFAQAGVYVLQGPPDEGDLPTIYIGEGDPVRPRLESHFINKDFWTRAVVFVSKDRTLNKAHIQCLESLLIQRAKEAKRAKLDNRNESHPPSLTEAEQADVNSFLEDMLSIYPLVGLTAFEKPQIRSRRTARIFIRAKNIVAEGQETAEGFVVIKGSQMVKEAVPSMHSFMRALRSDLHEEGVVVDEGDHYRFVQDYSFNSPSTSAGVILGRSANGRIEWKNEQGQTLKEIQEKQAGKIPEPD